jgi:uncharacterized protein (AIM24 family)
VPQYVLNGKRVLEAHVAGESFKALAGSMVAYEGSVTFKKASFGGGEGVLSGMKRRATGEGLQLMECQGSGTVLLANRAQDVVLVQLTGEQLQVRELGAAGARQRAQDERHLHRPARGASSGGQGLFTTTVQGHGTVALLSDGPPVALSVSPATPLVVDPQAFVAASGQLQQTFVSGVTWRSAIGEGGGEPFSLQFHGTGVVYVQPAER